MELNDLQAQRQAKLDRLRAAGLNPYPPRSGRSHTIAAVLDQFDQLAQAEAPVTLAGRIIGARRVMGKIAFAHIEDGSGEIQLWISRAEVGDEQFTRFRDDLDTFDIIQVTGILRLTQKGERSIFVRSIEVLAKTINPPPEKWAGLSDVEERHRQRYLDLIVNNERRAIFRARARAISTM
ncbi:MAG: lysine--tRNA ligase, partial [Oscillochloris sp.]|nr:lysine--tRNA ligase [Oscillochloris sp.]